MNVLMLGKHVELGLYRAEYLRNHGYQVFFPESKQDAVKEIQSANYDVVILSYTLSHASAIEMRELIEQSSPKCPVIALTEQPWFDNKIESDKVVLVSEGPEALLQAIQSIKQVGMRRIK